MAKGLPDGNDGDDLLDAADRRGEEYFVATEVTSPSIRALNDLRGALRKMRIKPVDRGERS